MAIRSLGNVFLTKYNYFFKCFDFLYFMILSTFQFVNNHFSLVENKMTGLLLLSFIVNLFRLLQ